MQAEDGTNERSMGNWDNAMKNIVQTTRFITIPSTKKKVEKPNPNHHILLLSQARKQKKTRETQREPLVVTLNKLLD